MFECLRGHETMLFWLGNFSLVTFIGTLVVIPIIVVRIPADYFTRNPRNPGHRHRQHPVRHGLGLLLKNALGIALILAGVIMLVLPGQGVIAILIGISLTNFPGKRALERRIVQQPSVFRVINWIRGKAHQPPLKIDTCV